MVKRASQSQSYKPEPERHEPELIRQIPQSQSDSQSHRCLSVSHKSKEQEPHRSEPALKCQSQNPCHEQRASKSFKAISAKRRESNVNATKSFKAISAWSPFEPLSPESNKSHFA